jgi:hypothetical protein
VNDKDFIPAAKEAKRQVVGGDEKGSLKSETVKYGHESQGTRTPKRLHWQGPVACGKDRPILFSERACHKKQNHNVQQY